MNGALCSQKTQTNEIVGFDLFYREQLLKSCWVLDAPKRPHAAEIVEFLANNPRIVSPCLDSKFIGNKCFESTFKFTLSLITRLSISIQFL